MNDFDYELLERYLNLFGFDLDQNPSKIEINSAYRKLIAKNHPDKDGSLDKEIQDVAEKRTKELNEAYDFIYNNFKKIYELNYNESNTNDGSVLGVIKKLGHNQYRPLLFIVVLILGFTIIPSISQYLNNNYNKVIIKRVIDGDTIEDFNGVRYRLIGIDTPEKGRQHYEDSKAALALVLCTFCDKSSKKNSRAIKLNSYNLTSNNLVNYSGVRVNMENKGKGRYGRTLAYISCRTDKNYSINKLMIFHGYAISYKKYTHERMEEYNNLEYEAKRNNKGHWKTWNRYGFNQKGLF